MSHLSPSEPCKGEKSYVNSPTSREYVYTNLEQYARICHERNQQEGLLHKELEDIKHRRELEQLRVLSSGSRHPEYHGRDSMNPATTSSHPVASAAANYPRLSVVPQQGRAAATPSHFEAFGLSSHIASNPPSTSASRHHHSAPVHSAAYRHLLPPHSLLPGQFSNSSGSSHIGLDAMWQQKMNPNPWMLAHYEEMRMERDRSIAQERERSLVHERERTISHDRERMAHDRERSMAHERERAIIHDRERTLMHERERTITHERERAIAHDRERIINHDRERNHERIERQKEERVEKERHREWVEQERIEREERERAQREAVQQHFEESLRLALQKQQKNIGWNPMSSNKNVGKGQESTHTTNLNHSARSDDRLRDQEKERAQTVRVSGSGQLKTIKVDKDAYVERPLTPGSAHASGQNTSKHPLKVMHPGQERSGVMYQPLVGSGGAFKPYEYSSNSSSPAPPAHQNTSPVMVARAGTGHYQQLQDQPQNLVKGDGKGNQEKITTPKYEQRDSKHSVCMTNSLSSRYSPPYVASKSSSPAANASYSYSLIQQGLVPNPMYIASTHIGNNTNSSTPVPFVHSSLTKALIRSGSPPASQQYPRVSPNAGISSGSPVCRPNSVPYTIPPSRIARSFSPVGPLASYSGGVSSGKIAVQDAQVANRTHINVQGSSHRSPSPAHLYGTQSNPGGPNSPRQSSPRLTVATSHPSINLSMSSTTSPFHSAVPFENLDNSGIPLVKRKLINDIASRKRPKSIDDGLLPPQLQPQVQTSNVDSVENQVVTPPYLVSNAPLLAEQYLSTESFTLNSDPASPAVATNLTYKLEPEATTPSMPDLCNSSPMTHAESPSDFEYSSEAQNYFSSLAKYKISAKTVAIPEGSSETIANASVVNDKTVAPPNALPDGSEEHLNNTSSLVNASSTNSTNSSSSFHPKLKKAWLQRHSENEDKKYPNETASDASCNIKTEDNKSLSEKCKPDPYVLIENSICAKYVEEAQVKMLNDVKPETKVSKLDSVPEEASLSSDSEVECVTKNGKRKSKSKNKNSSKRSKAGNGTDSTLDDQVSSPKKEAKKKSSSDSHSHGRKRGRKTKGRNLANDDTSKRKEMAKNLVVRGPEKPSIPYLKKTGEPFLQDGPCCDVAPRLSKCRECRMTPHQRNKKMPNIFCRFYAYRKLRYGKNGTILSAGFSEPADASEDDLGLWLPPNDTPPIDIEIEISKFFLTHVGDQFCDLVEMEREAQKIHMPSENKDTWKRVVQGVREMCDVCETTLFNMHWVCHKCGFVVCIDCYKLRKNGPPKDESSTKDRDDYQWLFCSNRTPHEQEKLMLTQIIPGTALFQVSQILHEIRRKWNIPAYCNCGIYDSDQDSRSSSNGICKLMSAVTKCFSSDKDSSRETNGSLDFKLSNKKGNKSSINGLIKQEDGVGGYSSESGGSPLSWLADVALNSSAKASDDQLDKDDEEKSSEGQDSNASVESDDDERNGNFSTLRELLIRPTGKMGGNSVGASGSQKTLTSTLDEVISCVIEQKVRKSDKYNEKQLFHFTRRIQLPKSGRELPPVRTCILAESSLLYPEIPHLWLGSGKILLLKDPHHAGNMQLFQEQWKRGQPVVVTDVGKKLDSSLWSPESFIKEFGDSKADFLNCLCGTLMQNQPTKKFWEGFDNLNKRIKDEDGESVVLKLEWPPAEEFSELLPSRFDDLMKALPLQQYTHRDGVFNMTSRLPDCFVQPDLGPRMNNSYGVSSSLGKGSTNLHIDVSDAVNVLAYVASSKDETDEISTETMKTLEESGCDELMQNQVIEKGAIPGAIWHIYHSCDADKIRDFLNKVSEEQGVKLNPHHDPIHNQEWYLDEKLRNRLFKEYGVEPYTIVQCFGDAILVPAGAPHQVLNLASCVKVVEDFISPESVGQSFFLTQEIRNLTDTLSNNEDRLQLKNIIFHAVKDALALLRSHDAKDTKT